MSDGVDSVKSTSTTFPEERLFLGNTYAIGVEGGMQNAAAPT